MSIETYRGPATEKGGYRNWRFAFWLLIGSALALRVWGLNYGLPFVYWVDEYHEVMRALELGSGSFNFARTTKGGFYYILFFEYGLYYAFLKMTGVVSGTREFAELFARDPTMFYLLGRVTAALLGTATVACVFLLGRQAYSMVVGLLAALFVAVNILHVDLSHRVGVDVPMTMLAILALYFGVKLADLGARRDYVLAGLFAGLATTTKLPAVLLAVPLLVAHTNAVGRSPSGMRGWLSSKNLWLAFLTFAGVLVITNPGIVLLAGHLIDAALATSAVVVDVPEAFEELAAPAGERPNLYLYYLREILDSMGWPLFVLSIAAAIYAAWRRKAPDIMLLTYAIANYLVIAGTSSEVLYYPRYALPIIVVLLVLAARLSVDLLSQLPRHRTLIGALGAAALVAWPASQAGVNNHVLTRTDTRTLAKDWIDANIPVGSHILIEGGKIAPSRETVQLSESPASLDRRIEYWKTEDPRQARFLEFKRAVHEGGGYELEIVKPDNFESFDAYVARGVRYFVLRPEALLGSRQAGTASVSLMERLRSEDSVRVIKVFDADPDVRRGPRIEIFQVEHDASAEN